MWKMALNKEVTWFDQTQLSVALPTYCIILRWLTFPNYSACLHGLIARVACGVLKDRRIERTHMLQGKWYR